jgi:NitT/TauT family transport system substrate-binding protein
MRVLSILFVIVYCLPLAAAEKVKLALNWKPEPEFGGFYAAEVGGVFKRHGLDVEIQPGGSGTPVVQMIAAGKVEFGIVSADEVVISRANGSDVVALFAVFQTSPQGVMAHAERGFKSVGDVLKNDGVLAIQKGLPYAEFVFKKYGAVKAKIVPYMGGVGNFLNDKKFSQQVFVTAEPIEAKKKGALVSTFLIADEGYNPYTVVLATRAALVKKNPTLVKAVVEASREGWRNYLDNPEPANRIMAGLNKAMDAETFVASTQLQKPLIETAETAKSGLGTMSVERWQLLVDQLSDLKLIKQKPEAKALFEKL